MKKKQKTSNVPLLFEVDAKVQIRTEANPQKKTQLYNPVNEPFPHNEYGINKAYLAGESIISNRGNKI